MDSGAKDGDTMDSGKYLLLGIRVTPLSSALPPLVLLNKLSLDLGGDSGAGKHLADSGFLKRKQVLQNIFPL